MSRSRITLLDLFEVIQSTGLKRSTIYAYMARKEFPLPLKLTARRVMWIYSEIEEWKKSKKPGIYLQVPREFKRDARIIAAQNYERE